MARPLSSTSFYSILEGLDCLHLRKPMLWSPSCLPASVGPSSYLFHLLELSSTLPSSFEVHATGTSLEHSAPHRTNSPNGHSHSNPGAAFSQFGSLRQYLIHTGRQN